MAPTDESRALLAEIRDNQHRQIEVQSEALRLQREHFELARRQLDRAERINDRAEAMQVRAASVLRWVIAIVVLVMLALAFLLWPLARRAFA